MPSQGKKKARPWVQNSVQYRRVDNNTSVDNEAEQQPLNGSSSETSTDGDVENYHLRSKTLARRLRRLAYTVIVVTTNLMSLFLGFMASRWSLNLDRSCAAHTTKYCEYPVQSPPKQHGSPDTPQPRS
jgi:hypothetical protein